MAEAHIRLRQSGDEGYGMIVGHDLEHAMAMAVIDAAIVAGVEIDALTDFVTKTAAKLAQHDDDTLRDVAATRVDMGSF